MSAFVDNDKLNFSGTVVRQFSFSPNDNSSKVPPPGAPVIMTVRERDRQHFSNRFMGAIKLQMNQCSKIRLLFAILFFLAFIMLLFCSIYLIKWPQSDKTNEAAYFVKDGFPHGGDGGGPEHKFDDSIDASLTYADYCLGAELHWTTQHFLNSVAFIYTNNHALLHRGRLNGKAPSDRSNSATFQVDKNDSISKVILYKGNRTIHNPWKTGGITELIVGIQFVTTNGETSLLYGSNESAERISESHPSYYLAYVKGWAVGYIDRLAFVWHKKCSTK